MDHSRQLPGAIAGIVLAVIVGLGLIAFFLRLLLKKNKMARMRDVGSLPLRNHGANGSLDFSDSNPQHQVLLPSTLFVKFFRRESPENTPGSSKQNRITRFTYKDLQKATNNFTTILGKGAFGPVYKAILPSTAVVAVKVLSKTSEQGEKEFQNEVMLLGRLHHKNLLNLVGYCAEGGHRSLAYDYMASGNLATRLHDEHAEVLSWDLRVSIALDVAKGIEYLHEGAMPPVIHRDIKSSNILLDFFMVARVADFGLSKEAESELPASGIRGTYGYMDPEYFTNNTLTFKSDVYSFGVLLFELISGRSPEGGLMECVEEIWMAAAGGRESWLRLLDPRLQGKCNPRELEKMALVATKCVELEPNKRPKMVEVVQALARLTSQTRTLGILKVLSSKTFQR